MLARGALPVEVAIQLAASAAPGDEVAITTLLAAAEALATTDPGASADLSRRALELAPERHPLRGPLVVQAAMSLHAAGRMEEAKAFADNAMREVLPVSGGGGGASRHRRHVVGLARREGAREPRGVEAAGSARAPAPRAHGEAGLQPRARRGGRRRPRRRYRRQ